MGRIRSRIMPENPNYNPTTSLAHLILAGTSGWALKQINSHRQSTTSTIFLSFGTFTFLLGHSLIGIVYYGHPNMIKSLNKIYEITSSIAEIMPIAILNTDLYHLYNKTLNNDNKLSLSVTSIYTLSGMIPILTELLWKHQHNDKIIDIVMIGNIGSLLYTSIVQDNIWASGLAALTTLNHFVFRRISERFDVPKMDIIAIGLSFFTIFSVNSLMEVKKV